MNFLKTIISKITAQQRRQVDAIVSLRPCGCGGKVDVYWCMCWNKAIATIKCKQCGKKTTKGRFKEQEAIQDWNAGILAN